MRSMSKHRESPIRSPARTAVRKTRPPSARSACAVRRFDLLRVGRLEPLPEGDPAALEVATHGGFGGIRIMLSDGLEDLSVSVIAAPVFLRFLERDLALSQEPSRHCLMQSEEGRIAHDLSEPEMEGNVGLNEGRTIPDRLLICLERKPELLEVLVGCVEGGVPDEANLEEQPDALQLAVAIGADQHLLNRRDHAGNDILGSWQSYPGPCAIAHFDQARSLQGDQRLPNRRPSDAEFQLQLA